MIQDEFREWSQQTGGSVLEFHLYTWPSEWFVFFFFFVFRFIFGFFLTRKTKTKKN
jgi:hypothetical protein